MCRRILLVLKKLLLRFAQNTQESPSHKELSPGFDDPSNGLIRYNKTS